MLKPQLQLKAYSAPDCCLCEGAREVLDRLGGELGLAVEWVDVTTDPELELRHRQELPVGYLEGRKVFKYRVDEEFLRRRVRRLRDVSEGAVRARRG